MNSQVETIIVNAGTIITNPLLREDGLIYNRALLIQNHKIEDIGNFPDLTSRYPDAEIIDASNCIMLPGFVDAHNHGQGITTLCHGTRDDFLEVWVFDWPGRQSRSEELTYWDASYAISRQLKNGITTSMRHDSPRFPLEQFMSEAETIIQAYSDAGIRFIYALGTLDKFGWVYGDPASFFSSIPHSLYLDLMEITGSKQRISIDEYFECFLQLHRQTTHSNMVQLFFGSMGPQWMSDELLSRIHDTARQISTGIHGPLLETQYQKEYAYRELGHSAVEHLDQLGVLNPSFSLAHGVWVTKKDIQILADRGVTVVHAPSSNLRLYSGIAPINFMRELGLNVSLCVDSEGINDTDDMFQEMRLAMMLHRMPGNESISPDPWDVLAMATINGARAVCLSDQIGTLEIGKEADLILVNVERLQSNYVHSTIGLVENLIYHGRPDCIDLVMVSGRIVYHHGTFLIPHLNTTGCRLREIISRTVVVQKSELPSIYERVKPYIREFYKEWNHQKRRPFYVYNSED